MSKDCPHYERRLTAVSTNNVNTSQCDRIELRFTQPALLVGSFPSFLKAFILFNFAVKQVNTLFPIRFGRIHPEKDPPTNPSHTGLHAAQVDVSTEKTEKMGQLRNSHFYTLYLMALAIID